MKFVRFSVSGDNSVRSGFIGDDEILQIPNDPTLYELLTLDSMEEARSHAEASGKRIPLNNVTLQAPLLSPPSIRDFMSFEAHVVTSMSALGRVIDPVWYEAPVFYFTNPAAVTGPFAPVRISPGSSSFDYELEIAAVIRRDASNVTVEEAENLIAGYMVLCDWSARDLQESEMKVGLGPAKGKDTATTLGPYFVTTDEFEPLRRGKGFDLELSVSVNGKQYSQANWESIYWSFPQMISYASRGTTLRAGDVIGSGTVGTGCILELGRVNGFDKFPYLVPGDVVEIQAGLLGHSRNVIQEPELLHPLEGTK